MTARNDTPLVVAGQEFQSRLLVGTGKYKDMDETREAIEASGAEIVTVASASPTFMTWTPVLSNELPSRLAMYGSATRSAAPARDSARYAAEARTVVPLSSLSFTMASTAPPSSQDWRTRWLSSG